MQARHYRVWRVFLLSVGGLFHALLLHHIGRLPGAGAMGLLLSPHAWIAVYWLAALAALAALLWESPKYATFLGLSAGVSPLPIYLVIFPFDWTVGSLGVCLCLVHGWRLLRPLPTRGAAAESGESEPWTHTPDCIDSLLFATVLSALAALLVHGYAWKKDLAVVLLEWGLLAATLFGSLTWEIRSRSPHFFRAPYPLYLLLVLAGAAAFFPAARGWVMPLLILRQLWAGGVLWREERGGRVLWRYFTERPAHLLVGSFAFVIFGGTILLSLPGAAASHIPLPPLDALFTATSAVCVTGLIVVDTGKDLSLFGQGVVLGLIQVGGLGIMTISTFIALLLGRNIGLREEFAFKQMLGEHRSGPARRLLTFMIVFTFGIEFIGALLLTLRLYDLNIPWPGCLWIGAFHSVSAFCNAGFSLFSDSLTTLARRDPGTPLLLSFLIILGGLGFGVTYSLARSIGRRGRVGLHVRMVLWTTLVLLLGGTLFFWLFEHSHSLRGLSWRQALLHAWFQSVTSRTAGFNTVDIGGLRPATLILMLFLMFVGGAPGSTAGGVKVTTLAVLVLAVRAYIRGRDSVVARKRRIGHQTVIGAAVLAFLALGVTGTVILLLTATQNAPPLALSFEAVSAFGTVGLSCGVTPHLTAIGKSAIIFLMFTGRVGPLTLLVMMRPRRQATVEYPTADVAIG